MSNLDEFAKAAITGILSNQDTSMYIGVDSMKRMCRQAFDIAERMLEESKRRQEPQPGQQHNEEAQDNWKY